MNPIELKDSFTDDAGNVIEKIYRETDPLEGLEGKRLGHVHAFAFYEGKLVIIFNKHHKTWSVPGGSIEPGETIEEALVREVQEESNMKVLHQELIGYQDNYSNLGIIRQTRSFCIVEPYGDFVMDPDDDIVEVKLIDPADYKQYFDWGPIGDRVMAVALEKLAAYEKRVQTAQ
jgi:ADP-ribose pyrophosphatase YjhB (NUDIX family)